MSSCSSPHRRIFALSCAGFIACSELWHQEERLIDTHLYAVNKQLILFQRMTKRWSKVFPKVSVRVAKEAHMERMIALHRRKDWKQVCLQLSPRTSLISFIWSVFVSNLPMILQRWNKSQMYLWRAKNICSVLFFMHFLAWNAKLNRISRSSQVKSSLFRQGGPISHRLVSKGALCKIKITWNKFKNLEITLKLCTRSLKIWVNVNNISMKYNFPRSIQFKEKQLKHVQVLY